MAPAGRRRIAVVTGTRAEYGLLRWLMTDLRTDSRATLQIVVTGAHMSDEHGHTIDELTADGFEVAAAVPLDLGDDAPVSVARAAGAAVGGLAAELERLGPD